MNLKHVILLGHRQQHGKDTCCDILENIFYERNISYKRCFFAELLKKQVAERYGLDAEKMEDGEYKKWCPPWVNPKKVEINSSDIKEYRNINNVKEGLINGAWRKLVSTGGGFSGNLCVYLKPRSVRDILIEEGCNAREIWGDAWADNAYRKIFNSGCKVGFISDYRFPNEYACFQSSLIRFLDRRFLDSLDKTPMYNFEQPKIHRILVHRPAGLFNNDGADGELPDLEDKTAWDFVIMNNVEGNGWKKNLEDQIKQILNIILKENK